ncbi:hypothetical protein [Actinomadura fibrosa]|nr:hypothetical protein [Actinomadura fibrosa]
MAEPHRCLGPCGLGELPSPASVPAAPSWMFAMSGSTNTTMSL